MIDESPQPKPAVGETLPRIWNSDFFAKTVNVISIDFTLDRPRIDYIHELDRFEPVERSRAPDTIYYKHRHWQQKFSKGLPDIFMIVGGIVIISQKFHDVLSRFDLGKTRMFEVPLYDSTQTERLPDQLYILHIAETKQAVDIEASPDVIPYEGRYRILTHENSLASHKAIAVRASIAGQGADLWVNPNIDDGRQLLYFSDPLRKAIKAAGIKARAMSMRECLVLP